jgi:hypothetical protein
MVCVNYRISEMCSPPNTGTFSWVFTYSEKQVAIQGCTCIIMNNAEKKQRPLVLSLAKWLTINNSAKYALWQKMEKRTRWYFFINSLCVHELNILYLRILTCTERELIAIKFLYNHFSFFRSSLSVRICSDKVPDVTDEEAAGGV